MTRVEISRVTSVRLEISIPLPADAKDYADAIATMDRELKSINEAEGTGSMWQYDDRFAVNAFDNEKLVLSADISKMTKPLDAGSLQELDWPLSHINRLSEFALQQVEQLVSGYLAEHNITENSQP